jgi:ribosomal protein S4
MSWNKYNLFNNARPVQLPLWEKNPETRNSAKLPISKRLTRKYHGQGIAERVFKTQLYRSRFNVVAGGFHKNDKLIWAGFYAGVERRLDTVIFRSLFASSIQQARQMVIHGHVELNGKIV